jgi:hypothetical protein
VRSGNQITFPENSGCGDLTAWPLTLRGKTFTEYDIVIVIYVSYSDNFGTLYTKGSLCPSPTLSAYDRRPLIGRISLNPVFLEAEKDALKWNQKLFYSMLQATFQVMAFTNVHLKNFVRSDEDGGGYWPMSAICDLDSGSPFVRMPSFLEEVSTFYGCLGLDKFYLENEITIDQRNPQFYWEARSLYPDIMVANFTTNPKVTKITQKFLQGTGWYDVDETLGAEINWGRNKGCAFLDNLCDQEFPEFNVELGDSLCSSEFDLKGTGAASSSDEYYDGCKIFSPKW